MNYPDLKNILILCGSARRLIDAGDAVGAELLLRELAHRAAKIQDADPQKIDSGNLDSLARSLNGLEGVFAQAHQKHKSQHPEEYPLARMRLFFRRNRVVIGRSVIGVVVVLLALVSWRAYDIRSHSLLGEYFNAESDARPLRVRRDQRIDFTWGYGSPFWLFKIDHFFVRWTGLLNVPKDGLVEFRTSSDDGVRLWIDDQLLIHDWTAHSTEENSASALLTKGRHRFKFEYFENDGNAEVQLFWRPDGQKDFEIIPRRAFSAGVY
jgi:hypothetical protein